MVINDNKLDEYIAIHKKEFGTDISKQDAYEQGMKLITMLKVIYKPIPSDEWMHSHTKETHQIPVGLE